MLAKCMCGKTKRFRGHRRNFTCPECLAARQKQREASLVEIVCAGCGRTRKVHPGKAQRWAEQYEGFLCGWRECKHNPDFDVPEPPIGWYVTITDLGAGGFHGWSYGQHTPESLAAVWRACEIRDAGLRLLQDRRAAAGGK